MFPDPVVYPRWLARPNFFPGGCVPVRLCRLGIPPPLPLFMELVSNFLDLAACLDPALSLACHGFCPVAWSLVYNFADSPPCLFDVCIWLDHLPPRSPPPAAGSTCIASVYTFWSFALMASVTGWPLIFTALWMITITIAGRVYQFT